MTIQEARAQLQDKTISAVELVQQSVDTVKVSQPKVHAYIEILEEEALAAAMQADIIKPLGGIPIAIKDNICTVEGHTTAASKMLEHFKSPYEATVIKRLKNAGAIIIGKTNLDEFAMGSSTEYSVQGVTKNPWDTARVAGGSSGGSAVAVATGSAFAALGTDTGGSIRQPASFCNVVGLKPTYGRVSRFGAIAYGSSLDQIGPFTRTVVDNALLLSVLAGQDSFDATSSPEKVSDYVAACGKDIVGMKVGVPEEFFGEGMDARVAKVVRAAISQLETLGAQVIPISLPHTSVAIAVYYLLAKAEASSNLSRYDGLRFKSIEVEAKNLLDQYVTSRGQGFGPEVKRAILMGTYALSAGYYDAWYKQASKVRTIIRREYEEAFKQVDVIAGPVTPEVAFKIGAKSADPLQMYLSDALTVPMPIAGVPAMSVPAGFIEEEGAKLPVGLQLTADFFDEATLFQVGHAYEQVNAWYKQEPTAAN
jgi:aspartyl-tRNA(Asn)/glutamyl-tRNA(Gln) amidotransferase subunit A